jgi:hypothetical protein
MTAALPNHARGYQAHGHLVMVEITNASPVSLTSDANGNPTQWTYRGKRQVKGSTGYGGWSDLPGTATVDIFNTAEDANTGTGVQGNGVDHGGLDYPSGFAMQPLLTGNIYPAMQVLCPDGSGGSAIEYWVTQANGEDGTCT